MYSIYLAWHGPLAEGSKDAVIGPQVVMNIHLHMPMLNAGDGSPPSKSDLI